ncbi:uncharacterized protein LOC118965305 [Oncorhynchus mykiss]|uniref:uncharacterized protein LOC118965305 n=1 Tax=Oncorhynchus mykiss TaxID=8022 RepID=UPI0018781DF1|nr:uncharacterized protein LOC118965305 [Oncorhynchus mykiss]
MDKLRKIRIVLTEILSADASYILQHVHQEDLVTPREYRNLHNDSKLHPEGSIVDLLDSLLTKGGDEKCTRFLTLLQQPVIRSTYYKLGEIKHIDIAPAPSSPAPPDAVPTSASSTVHTHRPTTSGSKIPTTPVKKNNRRRTTACGTITDVSEVKMGKAGGKYYQAVLNQEDGPMVILILDLEKRNIFLGAEKRRSSVKLKRISFEKLGMNKYQEGIKFTNKSELTYTRAKNTIKMEPTADEKE